MCFHCNFNAEAGWLGFESFQSKITEPHDLWIIEMLETNPRQVYGSLLLPIHEHDIKDKDANLNLHDESTN